MGLVPLCDRGGLCIVPPGPLGILRWCLRASQFGEPINSRISSGFNSGIHNRMGLPKARIEELVPVVDPQPSRVGDVWRATFLSVRGSWCLESRASEGRFLPLHVRPDTASKCESFQGGMRSLASPVLEGVIAGPGLHDPTGCGLTLVPRNSARGGRKTRTTSSRSPINVPTPMLTSFHGDRIESCT